MECLKQKHWLVVYTRARGEKRLCTRLISKGIEAYCPLQKTMRQWSDRKKMVTIPVFTSYVFVRASEYQRSLVLQDPLAVKFVYWLGKPAVIRDRDMQSLQHFVVSNKNIQLEAVRFEPGDQVAIKGGIFKGETAFVTDIEGSKLRLCLPKIGFRLVTALPIEKMEIA